MRIKYFRDTDTALVDFTDHHVVETREISENIYVDLDAHGNLVSMTIEHAKENAALSRAWGQSSSVVLDLVEALVFDFSFVRPREDK